MDRKINARELSELIGLSYTTLIKDLCLFDDFTVQYKKRYLYRYNYYFLEALYNFYSVKIKKTSVKYKPNYRKVLKNLKNIMKKL